MDSYDIAVVGLGIHGASTIYELAKRGVSVIGFDANPRLHRLGSSHGQSRIIRQAYFESPKYVQLLLQAYDNWRFLEKESGNPLLTITGGLFIGDRKSELVTGAQASADKHKLKYQYMEAHDVMKIFPAFCLEDNLVAIYEEMAGILKPELCVHSYLELARSKGATLHFEEPVLKYRRDGESLVVTTNKNSYGVNKLIITSGPWIGEFIAQDLLPVTVQRVVNVHFEPLAADLGKDFPVYCLEVPEGFYYGFPNLHGQGIKFGRHDQGQVCTPDTIERAIDEDEVRSLQVVLNKYIPGAGGQVIDAITCLYTSTADKNFAVGILPDNANVIYGSWCSGHGFKFGSVSGKVHADLALTGKTDLPVDFLMADRFCH